MSNILKTANALSVGASQTDLAVSHEFTPADRWNIQLQVVLDAVSESTGITFSLKDSFDGGSTYYAVGSESSVAMNKKTFTAGTAEITTVTFPAVASATQADYVHFTAQDGTKYAVWLDIDANGTAPTGALYVAADTQIEVDVVTGDTDAQVATKVKAAIGTSMDADFTVGTPSGADITFTQLKTGAVTDVAPKSADDGGAGSITKSVGTAGSDGGVNISTNAMTATSHGFLTGDRVYVSGTLPAGLTAGVYYIIKVDANTVKLASSQANALAGTAVDITDYGAGTCSIYQTVFQIRMERDDSSDRAQLPLCEVVRVVANSGSSDSCTVGAIYL